MLFLTFAGHSVVQEELAALVALVRDGTPPPSQSTE